MGGGYRINGMIYRFESDTEEFTVKNSHKYNNYFPLTNKWGSLLSSITPNLAGDIKQNNDRFLTPPATVFDLKNNLLCRRDFFITTKPVSETKNSPAKTKIIRLSDPYPDILKAGFFYHRLTKYAKPVTVEILNFIPFDLQLEVMQVTVTNKSKKALNVSGCSCVPLYGRSEATLRDHRHVSSLLNRICLTEKGILLRPTLLFNEEGHSLNQTTYFCLGKSNRGRIKGQFPTLNYFCGESNLFKPDAIYKNQKPAKKKKEEFDGKEILGALQFKNKILQPEEKINYTLLLGLVSGEENKCREKINQKFFLLNTNKKIEKKLSETKKYWRQKFSQIDFDFSNKNYNGWLRWVKAQPTLRKLFGCSFLPHFDYGKGGRGWRDLWQDALTLLYHEPNQAKNLILNSLKGIRIDGSNATIIKKDGSFLSDRNKISRVWSDHGIWPYLSLSHYLSQTSGLKILNKQIPYFKDHLIARAAKTDFNFSPKDFKLRDQKNNIYRGTVLEHLLIQHLTAFFNVGKNNIIRLENADWNDALDMAGNLGETVSFSFMYAHNLKGLAELIKKLKKTQSKTALLKELIILLDTLNQPVDYDSYRQKQERLKRFLAKTEKISGEKITVNLEALIFDLEKKQKHLSRWLQKKEWLKEGFFNGYYDNKGKRVGGKRNGKIKMMLAPQVFAIMSGIATQKQVEKIWQSANKYLKGKNGAFRLNTNFGSLYQDLGRAFGFKFGNKENGAYFNHMAIMFAYSLYKTKLTRQAAAIMNALYGMAASGSAANYPQLPEYFNNQGQGLYLYLTGSASWYIHTLLSQVLGIKYTPKGISIEPNLSNLAVAGKKIKIKWKDSEIILTKKPNCADSSYKINIKNQASRKRP